jgi:hypothetical protein
MKLFILQNDILHTGINVMFLANFALSSRAPCGKKLTAKNAKILAKNAKGKTPFHDVAGYM